MSGAPRLGDSVATGGIVVVTFLFAASLGFDYRYPKQDFEGAMRLVLAEQRPGDAVVTTGLPADPYRMLYGKSWENVSTADELNAVRRRSARTWVLWTFPRYLELHAPEVDRILRDECTDRRTFRGTVGGGDVLVCTLPAVDATNAPSAGAPQTSAVPTQ